MIYISFFMIIILLLLIRLTMNLPIGLNRINIFSMVVYRDFGILTAIGLCYWLLNDDIKNSHYIISGIPNESLVMALFASFIFMFFFIVYSSFWSLLLQRVNNRFKSGNILTYMFFLKIFLFIQFFCVGVMFFKNPPVLINLLSGASAFDVSVLRSEVGSGSSFYKIVRSSWVPMTSYTLYYFYLGDKNNINTKYFFYLSCLLAVICALWSGAKSPIATLLLGYLGVYFAQNYKNYLKSQTILFFAFFSLTLILLMYAVTTLNTDATILDNLQVAERRFFGQAGGVAYAFYMYPNFIDFKYFNGVSNFLASITGGQFTSVYGDLIDIAAPEFSDISGAMSSFAAGDAYGLFGWYGIFFGPLFASFFYSLFYYLGAQGNIKHVFVGIYAIYFGNAYLASSFYSFIWPVGIFLSVFPFVFIYILSLKRV